MHFPCAGSSTTQSGHYTREMTDFIIQSILSVPALSIVSVPNSLEGTNLDNETFDPNDEKSRYSVFPVLDNELIKQLTSTLSLFSKQTRTLQFNNNAKVRAEKQTIQPHRDKGLCGYAPEPFFALVHKLLTKADAEYHSDGAKIALDAELNKLKGIGTWEHDSPVSWFAIQKMHPDATVSRLFPIVSMKHAETDNPVHKARIVLQGSNIQDVNGASALFSEVSSSPTNLNTIRAGVVYAGLIEGATVETADAVGAYTQRLLDEDDDKVYIRLPKEWWPASAKNIADPVFRLRRPLYGHPKAGLLWEQYLQEKIALASVTCDGQVCSWQPVEAHPNTWFLVRPGKAVAFMTIYVDDFVMSGVDLAPLWIEIRKHINTTAPEPINKILSCLFHIEKKGAITTITQSMKDFFSSSIDAYKATPGFKQLRQVDTPSMELDDYADETPGRFAKHASSLLMKIFYGARCCRPELLFSITYLARFVTKWTVVQDKKLERLFDYVNTTLDTTLVSTVDSLDLPHVFLASFPDADFSGCKETGRSTSGNWLELGSPSGNTTGALEWASKRQTATATSTTEAEMASALKILKDSALPSQLLWEKLLQRDVEVKLYEDNQATLKIIESGYSPKLRHLGKSQRVDVAFVSDCCKQCGVIPEYISTDKQKGDFLTKGLARDKHCKALDLVGIRCKLCAA